MVFNFKYCAYFRESLLFSQDNKVIFIGLMRHQDLDEWNLLDEILVLNEAVDSPYLTEWIGTGLVSPIYIPARNLPQKS